MLLSTFILLKEKGEIYRFVAEMHRAGGFKPAARAVRDPENPGARFQPFFLRLAAQ